MLARADVLPPPYVLDPAPDCEPPQPSNERISVTLRLFGTATRAAAYALLALTRAAADGIGARRTALAPVSVRCAEASSDERDWGDGALREAARARPLAPPPSMPPAIELQFMSPLRLRLQNDLVTPDGLGPAQVFGAAVRRASLIWRFHGPAPIEADFRALQALASRVGWCKREFRWVESARYSTRQKTRMQTGGILGTGIIDLEGLEPLWPFLWFGQWLHIGKNTTMGFGRYRLHAC